MKIRTISKSDELASFREIFSESDSLASFGNIFQISLILDANTIISDIRWICLNARDQKARTSLQESIDSSVIVAYAPTYLDEEVRRHIPKIAREAKLNEDIVLRLWEDYKSRIRFIDAGGEEENDVDPKDVPYVKLHHDTGFPVITKDNDISEMGAKTVTVEITTLTRDYSRSAAIEYRIKLTGFGTLHISNILIQSSTSLIKSIYSRAQKIPDWAWLVLIAGCLWLWSRPSFRVWLTQIINNLPSQSVSLGRQLLVEINEIFQEYTESSEESQKVLEKMRSKYGV